MRTTPAMLKLDPVRAKLRKLKLLPAVHISSTLMLTPNLE
jgi:hypothetical protein